MDDDEWWSPFVSEDDEFKVELSGKLVILFDILKECEEIGDKVLLFSQSLLSLDLLETMLKHQSDGSHETGSGPKWIRDVDYFRMDGSTGADLRSRYTRLFNDEENFRARLFLISTKAGCLGINLVSANRVVIFDASWNPTHDIQSIFRVYRFGQEKPVYIYRFLAQGTMEEKIYDRQVTKQSLSIRVLDEQQVDRHFTLADLQELYSFEPDGVSKRPTPKVPKDRLLAELILRHKELITYHEHDSLLMSAQEENLSEEDRKAAWLEYEIERKGFLNGLDFGGFAGYNFKFDSARIIEDIQLNYPGLPMEDLRKKFEATIKMLTEAKRKELMKQQQQQQAQMMQRHAQQSQQVQQQMMRMQQAQLIQQQQMLFANQNRMFGKDASGVNQHLANALADMNAGQRRTLDDYPMFQNMVTAMLDRSAAGDGGAAEDSNRSQQNGNVIELD